jgi:mono/diheme cytochrome c family protein
MARVRLILATAAVLAAVLAQPSAAADKNLVARGKYLVTGPAACGNCHTQRGRDFRSLSTKVLAGGHYFVEPGLFETWSRNITQDKDTGIGTWTDAQIIRAVREAKNKEGETLGPPMPFGTYNRMSDDDVKAIVAYLRTVKPVHNEVQAPKYGIPLQPEAPAKGLAAPPRTDKVAYGDYLVNAVIHCHECHTPMVGPQQDFANQYMAGGLVIQINGVGLRTRNITQDKETGIGAWTDAEIKRAITDGIAKDGRKLIPLMPFPYFKNMTAADVDAVVAYLRTVKPVNKKIEPNPTLAELMKRK